MQEKKYGHAFNKLVFTAGKQLLITNPQTTIKQIYKLELRYRFLTTYS